MTTKLNDNWEAEQDAEIKRELEQEIDHERTIVKGFKSSGYRPGVKGERREAMLRYHERKLEKALELYCEGQDKGWF